MDLILLHILLIRGFRTGKVHLLPSLLFGRKKTPLSNSILFLASLVCLVGSFRVSLVFFFLICFFVCLFCLLFFNKKGGEI